MEFNKYQTPLEELTFTDKDSGKVFTWENAPEEIKKDFNEFLTGVPLIRWLISKDRPYVKDLPRDENGRAVIDITHPPILENVDYFRQTALHFKETGRLTDLRPNRNPNSEYYKWQHEETRRCWNGYLREEDGAFVPGYMYWYLNYSPIMLSRTVNGIDYQVPDMPDFWEGVWWRYLGWWDARMSKLNFAEISSRGKSKSYSLSSGLSRIYTIGDFEPPPGQKVKNQRAVVMAGTKEFLTKDGTLNKFEDMVSFLSDNTEYPAKQLQASLKDMSWQRGFVDLDSNTKKGTLNTVLGVAIKEDIEKGRGKRAALIGLEEFGAFPNVDAVYNIALPSVTDGERVFGLMVLIGTGGAEGNDFSGALNMIYHPKGYGIKSYENVWDIEGTAPQTSLFCFPAYVNRAGCMNEEGISDVTLALFRICCERWIKKYNNPDPMQLTRTKAEYPVTLRDAIMQRDGAYFPVAQLMERLQEIDSDPGFYDGVYVGDFRQTSSGTVEFYNADLNPIRSFPHKTNKIGGAVEIYEMPVRDSTGKVPDGRYIAGLDPIDDDESTTQSLVSLFIFDLWTDRVVCEWTGRLDSADECYERVRLALMFYNAKMLYENNKKGVFTYLKMMNCIKYVMETPSMLKDRTTQKENLNNTDYGASATTGFNQQARFFIKDWLLKGVKVTKIVDGEEQVLDLHNYNLLKQRALIQELIAWNKDGNFDRVSAFGMLMFASQEKLVTTHGDFGRKKTNQDYKGNDEFFQKQWENFARKYHIDTT